ncbi:hypothetical protein D9M71_625310 [compost metagenome]
MHQQRQHAQQDRFPTTQDSLRCTLQTQLTQGHTVRPTEVDQLATLCLAPQHFVCTGGGLNIAHCLTPCGLFANHRNVVLYIPRRRLGEPIIGRIA